MRRALVAGALLSLLTVTPAYAAEDNCAVELSEVQWGFKESFRSYISGTIALGTWSTDGDVSYATPTFYFSDAEGSVAPDLQSGELAFDGELRFEGHAGILNTSLSNPRIVFLGDREAAFYVDVRGDTMDGLSVEKTDVDFVRISWPRGAESVDAESGLWRIEDATVTLTALGSEAFGTYVAGEVFDPMTIALQVEPGCLEQPANPGWLYALLAFGVFGIAGGALWFIARGSRSPEQGRR